MKQNELFQILIAVIILTILLSFSSLLKGNFFILLSALLFSIVILVVNIGSKKFVASLHGADVEHEIWRFRRYGFKPKKHFKNPVPTGVFVPLLFTAISLGLAKITTILSYETFAMKKRKERKDQFYTFTEVTEWENGIIGAAGIFAVLLLSFISYWIPGLELLFSASAYYAFWNLVPFSKLDGMQIFFGSRVIWTALAIISAIFAVYAVILV